MMASPPPSSPGVIPLGTRLGHYEVRDLLGAGGMGQVYVARDTTLGREVALKLLPDDVAADADRRARFEREARLVAAVAHPGIVTIHSIEEADGRLFLTMELVQGQPLSRVIRRGGLPLTQLLDTAVSIADAVSAAHARGITHRDLKPANVMVQADGTVKVLDFGVAKRHDALAATDLTSTASLLTTDEGRLLGTIAYMSPEQAQGRTVDPRSDVFSLGIMLYEMATGVLPFSGETPLDTLTAILRDTPVPVTTLNPALPKELGRVIRRAMAKDPNRRPQTARDLSNELDEIRQELRAGELTPATAGARLEAIGGTAPRAGWRWTTAAAVAGAAIAIVGGASLMRLPPEPGAAATPKATPRIVVVPFENLGPPDDEYFAVGLSDEITTLLAGMTGVAVISRSSARQYAATRKTIREIAEELRVDYIVDGTVRWDREAATGGRVRVSPQLIRVSDDTQLWGDRYERSSSELFDVQSEIAHQVAEALDLTVAAPAREGLQAPPTRNPEAYQAYLRGLYLDGSPTRGTGEVSQLIAQMFERAVELDPRFALAHARLSYAYSNMYRFGADRTEGRLEAAKAAAERARAIDPDLPWVRFALAVYHYSRADYEPAIQELESVRGALGSESEFFLTRGAIKRRVGDWEGAVRDFDRAVALDPRDPNLVRDAGQTLVLIRRYDEARRYFERSIALAPDQWALYQSLASLEMREGNLTAARRVLSSAPGLPQWESPWLDLERLSRKPDAMLSRARAVPVEGLQGQRGILPKALVLAQAYALAGQADAARASFTDARDALLVEASGRPGDHRLHGALGLAYAGLGQKREAMAAARRSTELLPVAKDANVGWAPVEILAETAVTVGEVGAAFTALEQLLSNPTKFSIHFLKLDPVWDPLRADPRYAALLERFDRAAR